ncbi:MAG: Ferritin Dps family protein [candidate division TM6 bacterium GW2011_GWF2_28_16]|nr:MAG: Ferritin Dps family protein [candidate division TM6 bacterium GW2011_GWF2_28_16]
MGEKLIQYIDKKFFLKYLILIGVIMGKEGIKIIKLDVNELIKTLNKAFADEWLAYYQYWLGAQVAKGPMKEAVIAELTQHAADELRHAQMLSARIIQLGGTPLLSPKDWYTNTNCGYSAPENPLVKKLLEQNIEGERCAIDVYQKLVDLTKDKDIITYNMASQILSDEVEHEDDLENLLEDINLI